MERVRRCQFPVVGIQRRHGPRDPRSQPTTKGNIDGPHGDTRESATLRHASDCMKGVSDSPINEEASDIVRHSSVPSPKDKWRETKAAAKV